MITIIISGSTEVAQPRPAAADEGNRRNHGSGNQLMNQLQIVLSDIRSFLVQFKARWHTIGGRAMLWLLEKIINEKEGKEKGEIGTKNGVKRFLVIKYKIFLINPPKDSYKFQDILAI